jgi:hypothetical protein
LNPEVQQFLSEEFTESEEGTLPEMFNLNFNESKAIAAKAFLFGRWKRLKEKIRKIFCQVTGGLGDGDISWKDIISGVLLALIPAFASGIPALVLPIVIALVASLMKFGYSKVCPAA